jgi:adenylylsulfate kinase-like enzyme
MFKDKNFSIWIIGPSAAGKTTISKLLYNYLSKEKKNLVRIDGDEMRTIWESNLGYDKISRSKNTLRYVNLVKWLSEFNISTVLAVISSSQEDRLNCRKEIKNYYEIYLKSSRDVRIKRDKKKLYLPAINGEKKNVVDVDIPYENPSTCDLEIDTENQSPDEIFKEIIKKLNLENLT